MVKPKFILHWHEIVYNELQVRALTYEEIADCSGVGANPHQVGAMVRSLRTQGIKITNYKRLLLIEGVTPFSKRAEDDMNDTHAIQYDLASPLPDSSLEENATLPFEVPSEGLLSPNLFEALETDYHKLPVRNVVGISEIVYCPLKIFKTRMLRRRPDIDRSGLVRMFRGRAYHEAIRKIIMNNKNHIPGFRLLAMEKPVAIDIGDYRLLGRYDIKIQIKGYSLLMDFKVVDWPRTADHPHEHYRDQVSLYAFADEVDYGGVCYLDARTMTPTEYVFKIDRQRVRFLLHRFHNLMESLKSGNPPDRPYASPNKECSWECGFCAFRIECFPDDIEKAPDQSIHAT